MRRTASNVLELIGDTPLVRLNRIPVRGAAAVYAKLEGWNPGRSVKDRVCVAMVDAAEQQGRLRPGGTIVGPTSGNTGVGIALVGAVRGYRVLLAMPDTTTRDRLAVLRAYGAEVILTPTAEGLKGATAAAQRLADETPGAVLIEQFADPINPETHRRTTAAEIVEALEGRLDAFVAGIGTGGTITGVGEALKERHPEVQVIGVEPAASAVLSGGSPGRHRITGIGAGFVPDVLNMDVIDEVVTVSEEDAIATARALCRCEGILAGPSAGAATWAAARVAARMRPDQTCVVLLPDCGARHATTEQV